MRQRSTCPAAILSSGSRLPLTSRTSPSRPSCISMMPPTAIQRVSFTPHIARWEIGVGAWIDGEPRDPLRLSVTLTSRGTLLACDTYTVISGEAHRRIALSDPGIDDSRNELLWSPDAPNLVDVQLDLWGERGELIDEVKPLEGAIELIAALSERGQAVVLSSTRARPASQR